MAAFALTAFHKYRRWDYHAVHLGFTAIAPYTHLTLRCHVTLHSQSFKTLSYSFLRIMIDYSHKPLPFFGHASGAANA